MGASSATYELKPVAEIPPLVQKGRRNKYESMLDQIKAQPSQAFELATYHSPHGAANVRSNLKASYGSQGFRFEARKVDAAERGGTAGETWSVLYAVFNGPDA